MWMGTKCFPFCFCACFSFSVPSLHLTQCLVFKVHKCVQFVSTDKVFFNSILCVCVSELSHSAIVEPNFHTEFGFGLCAVHPILFFPFLSADVVFSRHQTTRQPTICALNEVERNRKKIKQNKKRRRRGRWRRRHHHKVQHRVMGKAAAAATLFPQFPMKQKPPIRVESDLFSA